MPNPPPVLVGQLWSLRGEREPVTIWHVSDREVEVKLSDLSRIRIALAEFLDGRAQLLK